MVGEEVRQEENKRAAAHDKKAEGDVSKNGINARYLVELFFIDFSETLQVMDL
jgi:hypothetical protein